MKDKLIIAGIVLALVIGIAGLTGPEDGKDGRNGRDGRNGVGSGSSLSTDSSVNFGGVVHEYRSGVLAQSTTTPCAFLSPSASSTLLSATARIDIASSTATTWGWYQSITTNTATSVLLTSAVNAIAADGQGTIMATTTPFPPNSFLILAVVDGDTDTPPTGLVPVGSCKAEFQVL